MLELVKDIVLEEDEQGVNRLYLNGQEFPFWTPENHLLTITVPNRRSADLESLKLEVFLHPDVTIRVGPGD